VADAELVEVDGGLALPDESPPASPRSPSYALLASIDGLFLLRRDLAPLLDPADAERALPGESALGAVPDLEHHAIVDRGRVVGLWDYDVEAGRVVWLPFVAPSAKLREVVARTESYVRDQLGDARSFSLDSAKSRAPRLAALRAAGADG
jgi:hypothetical protein